MKLSTFLFVFFITGFLAMLGASCANIVPPQGGPKDSLPPRLVKASPRDSATHFAGRRIELEFNEYIDIQDVQKNLVFTPTFTVNPQVEVKSRTITVKLRDTLEPNTTYSFNFGDAIKDINEGNVLRGFTYTFSTGAALDSLTFSGRVFSAETGKIDTTLTVVLYRNLEDSAVVKERPRYLTKLNGNGDFTFRNLPPGRYAVYAWSDPSNIRRYQNKTQQLFAFLDSPVVVRNGTPAVVLAAYKEASPATTTPTPAVGSNPILGNRGAGGADKRLRFTTTLTGNQQDLLSPFALSFDKPLRTFDSTQMRLTIDSTLQPVAYAVSLDSSRRKITITTNWKEGAEYNLILNKSFAEDSAGRQLLKSDTLRFTAKKRNDYAPVSIRVRNLDLAQKPVLQFLTNGAVVLSFPIPNGVYTNPLFVPGDYELRVFYDRNGNGIWDPGQYFGTKRQPEVVKPIERRATLKAGVTNDFEVSL